MYPMAPSRPRGTVCMTHLPDIEKVRLRRRLREFANEVKRSNMALRLPDDLIDSIPDGLILFVREQLEAFRIVKRPDGLWEERRL